MPELPSKTRVWRQIAPESSPERSATSLSHSFFVVPCVSPIMVSRPVKRGILPFAVACLALASCKSIEGAAEASTASRRASCPTIASGSRGNCCCSRRRRHRHFSCHARSGRSCGCRCPFSRREMGEKGGERERERERERKRYIYIYIYICPSPLISDAFWPFRPLFRVSSPKPESPQPFLRTKPLFHNKP